MFLISYPSIPSLRAFAKVKLVVDRPFEDGGEDEPLEADSKRNQEDSNGDGGGSTYHQFLPHICGRSMIHLPRSRPSDDAIKEVDNLTNNPYHL